MSRSCAPGKPNPALNRTAQKRRFALLLGYLGAYDASGSRLALRSASFTCSLRIAMSAFVLAAQATRQSPLFALIAWS
jgi:hypothetical protein